MKTLVIEKCSNGQYYINSSMDKIKQSHPWLPVYFFIKYPEAQEIAFNNIRLGRTLELQMTLKEVSKMLKNKNMTIEDLKQSPIKIKKGY
jgi:hypothetical protein